MSRDKAETAEELANAFGYLTVEEVKGIQWLCNKLTPDPRVINIGAGSGTSTIAMFESRDDIVVTSIDQRIVRSPLGSLYSELQALKDCGLYDSCIDRYQGIQGRSHDIAKGWTGPQVDLIFIDDGHTYPEVAGDIEFWLPHIKHGGYLVLDDYVPAGNTSAKSRGKVWGDVAIAADDYLSGFEEVLWVDTIKAWRIP